jgi:hypothetical protein
VVQRARPARVLSYYAPVLVQETEYYRGSPFKGDKMPAGTPVLEDRDVALRMMNEYLGGCLVFHISSAAVSRGAETRWGWDWGWRTLIHETEIDEVLYVDDIQVLVDRAERMLLGKPGKSLRDIAEICRRPRANVRPDDQVLKNFFTLHGRSPTGDELRNMSKRRT